MKKVETRGAPSLGNGLGLLVGLWAIDKYDFLPVDQQVYIVAALGTLFIHLLFVARRFFLWVGLLIMSLTKNRGE